MIFLGDFIDRGPQIREVLEIVRPMTSEGFALAGKDGTAYEYALHEVWAVMNKL